VTEIIDAAGLVSERLWPLDEHALDIAEHRSGRLGARRRRGWLVRRALVVADIAGLLVAFALTEFILDASNAGGRLDQTFESAFFVLSLPVWVVLAKIYGLYDRDEERTNHSTADDLPGVFHMVTVSTWIVFAVAWSSGLAHPVMSKVVVFWLLAIVTVFGFRAVARGRCRHAIAYLQNTVIVGEGEVGQGIARKFLRHPEYGINLVGFVDAEPRGRLDGLDHIATLGSTQDISELVELFDIERVVIAFSNDDHETTLRLIRELNGLGVQIDVVPRLFEIIGTGVDIHMVEGTPLLGMRSPRLSASSILLKRSMDIAVASISLVVLSPLLALVAVVVKLGSRGPVFFRQVRMGSGDQTFTIWKFRTMVADADIRKHEVAHLNKHLQPGGDSRMFKIEADPRVTRIGGFLRRTSIDELPQLFNVLSGEMSIVGPRPLILEEDIFVEDQLRRRLHLKPGITGLWQVEGRSDVPFDDMVKLDYLYVTNWSIWNDLRLMLRTLPLLLFRSRHTY
jgi:exopolysaccharide biosynthesis polyprenyl glycosylphosphotransferase